MIVSPATLLPLASELLSMLTVAVWDASAVAVSVGEVTSFVPKEPVAEAILVTEPASRSAWVTV